MSKPAGIVLAGGESRRMGCDKAVAKIDGATLLERAISLARGYAEMVIVVGPFREPFASTRVAFAEDMVRGFGPLGGILTGLTASPKEANIVVACDMPFVTGRVLERLLENSERADAVVYRTDQRLQPLPAFLNTRCLAAVQGMVGRGEKAVRGLFDLVKTNILEADDEWVFADIDTQGDLERARSAWENRHGSQGPGCFREP
jgi:molybdopterin-guanine dinucleotide biosynthesis protein A